MKTLPIMLASAALFTFGAQTSFAECGAQSGKQARIAKDGTHAPLEAPKGGPGVDKSATGTTSTYDDPKMAKNGGTMPLANKPNGGDRDLATSQQDAEAQQHGGKTAAAESQKDQGCD